MIIGVVPAQRAKLPSLMKLRNDTADPKETELLIESEEPNRTYDRADTELESITASDAESKTNELKPYIETSDPKRQPPLIDTELPSLLNDWTDKQLPVIREPVEDNDDATVAPTDNELIVARPFEFDTWPLK